MPIPTEHWDIWAETVLPPTGQGPMALYRTVGDEQTARDVRASLIGDWPGMAIQVYHVQWSTVVIAGQQVQTPTRTLVP